MTFSIQTFRGFGSAHRVCIKGQVTRGDGSRVRRPDGRQSGRTRWHRLVDALRLAISPRVSHTRVRVECHGVEKHVAADDFGHFSTMLELPDLQLNWPWENYSVELLEPHMEEPVREQGEVLVSGPSARRVVVSDIDDTIIYTGVSNKLMMLWRLFAHAAEDRVPFPGIAELYRGLYRGKSGEEHNPMIYISRSPWSIYPVLEEFFLLHEIPIGPVLQLREWGITLRHPYPRRARSHKAEILHQVAETYPDLPMLLLGDSGQQDPELYTHFASTYPHRVEAVYIRDVGTTTERSRELEQMKLTLARQGIPMVIAPETSILATDACEHGFISLPDFNRVRESAVSDEP